MDDLSRRLQRLARRIPILLLLPIVGFGTWVTVDPPYKSFPPIGSDGLGYYAWTNAILDGNFNFCQWPQLKEVAALSGHDPLDPHRCLNRYTPGMALLRLPVMAPIALISGHGDAGKLVISEANERADQWLGLATLLIAAWLMWAALRRLAVGTLTAQLTVLVLVFGTGLFHYAVFDSSFTHDTSAALFAALIFVGVGAMRSGVDPRPWVIFVIALFIAWTRLPNILPLLILVAAWVVWRTRNAQGAGRLRAALRLALPALVAVACVAVFQVLYIHWATNTWTLNSYGAEKLSLTRLEQWNVLFSYNHGLFLWYPVLALMLIVALWQRESRNWGWVALACVAALTAVYGSWGFWYLGGAMGERGFVDIVPVISVAGGLGLAQIRPGRRAAAFVLAGALSWVTVELMAGYWSLVLPEGQNTGAQYWEQVIGPHAMLNESPPPG